MNFGVGSESIVALEFRKGDIVVFYDMRWNRRIGISSRDDVVEEVERRRARQARECNPRMEKNNTY